ncbi:hypothetical protein HK102_001511 [Quaeritorhiza haematococci]|nr:hypothetical protein HK102_001511 [Quaeritorhiza haematococci]
MSKPNKLRRIAEGKQNESSLGNYDRFIPNRNVMDLATSQFNMSRKEGVDVKPQGYLDSAAFAYQEEIAKACGVALDKRILAFKAEPPPSHKDDLRTTWNRPLRPANSSMAKRRISNLPERVLDAPGLLDDYYLNLLDWSSQNILAVALDKTVYLWNADTGAVQDFCQTADNDYISSIQWTADGSYLAIGTYQGDTQIWDIESTAKVRSMLGHTTRVGVLSWEKHLLSSGSRDGSIWNHDVRVADHKVAELIGHTSEVCGLAWRPDGQLLASGGNDNLVNIWDARSSLPKFTKTNHTAAVKAIAWCPWQLNLLATGGGSHDRTINFWNTTTAAKLSSIDTGSQVTSLIWSREYKEILSSHGFPNNHLSIWSYPSLMKVADLPGHDARVLHTALSPDGQTVASGASDENLKFWKAFESRKASKIKEKGGSQGVTSGVGGRDGAGGQGNHNSVDEELANSVRQLTIR